MVKTIMDYVKEIEEKEKERVKHCDRQYGKSVRLFSAMFSDSKRSGLSSKKIERFITFITFLTLSVVYISINIASLSVLDFLEITLVWLGYAGYNTYTLRREKKDELNSPSQEVPFD